jgi:methyl-accepting chemotaxis protein
VDTALAWAVSRAAPPAATASAQVAQGIQVVADAVLSTKQRASDARQAADRLAATNANLTTQLANFRY